MGIYSLYGSDAFDQKMDAMLSHIRNRFETEIDCSDISALILAGGYGRGEGGVLKIAETEDLYNDLDFFVLSKLISASKTAEINRKLHFLHKELSALYGIDVDFAAVKPISSLPNTPKTLMMYDFKHGHKVILGKPDILKYMPDIKASDLSMEEALKLLLNRGMGLYFAQSFISSGKAESENDFINRNIHKAYQGIGDAILIAEKRYHWSNPVRMKSFNDTDASQYTSKDYLISAYLESMQFKMLPSKDFVSAEELCQRLEKAITLLKDVWYALWSKYLGIDIKSYGTYQEALHQMPGEDSSAKSITKNLVLNFRDIKGKAFDLKLYTRYPRYRLFYVFPWLLFAENADMKAICRALGLPDGSIRESCEAQTVELWKKYN